MRWMMWAYGGVLLGLGLVACGDDEQQHRSTTDRDGDGWPAPIDCDDQQPDVFPGADEVPYDGIDQDCSGSDLEDVDGDGFDGVADPEAGSAGAAGAAGASGSPAGLDCDDRRPDVSPAGVEICGDGIDQDCSGSDLACDGVDRDGDGLSSLEGDCNDLDAEVGPERDEVYYNGVDDDCDPTTDDGDQDGDGFSVFAGGDCDDEAADVFPGAEEIAYDGVDQDCSGADLDDVDGDGVPGGALGADCDDLDASVGPDRFEVVADGVDQNCDGSDLAGIDAFVPFGLSDALPAAVPALAAAVNADGEAVALAAWPDSRTVPSQDVYAQLLDAAGQPQGDATEIIVGGLSKQNVSVASSGEGFLVTWQTTDGVFGALVGADGVAGAPTQIAPAGAVESSVGFGGGNYATVWRQADVSPSEIRLRMLRRDGVKGENLQIVADASAVSPSVAGRVGDLIVVWSSASGIDGRILYGLEEPLGDFIGVVENGFVDTPDIAASDEGYYVAYRRSVTPYSAHGVALDGMGVLLSQPARLSGDSPNILRIDVASTPAGYFVAWNDIPRLPSLGYGAIYGRQVGFAGELTTAAEQALHVEYNTSLGGIALTGDTLLATSRGNAGIGSLPVASY